MVRIGFSGVPSTGKSTLARLVAAKMTDRRTELVPEYARRFINRYGNRGVDGQFRILAKQRGWEDSLPPQIQVLVSESPLFLSFAYATLSEPSSDYDVLLINDLFKEMNKANFPRRYDVVFHLPPNIGAVDDGTRAKEQLSPEWRDMMDQRIRAVFTIFPPVNMIEIQSTGMEERVSEVFEHLRRLKVTEVVP